MIKLSLTHSRSLWSSALLIFIAIAITVSSFTVVSNLTNKPVDATLAGFDPGNIIEDAVMSNKDTMSVSQIQTFLNSKNPCNNTDTYKAAWYPNLHYTIRDGKFVCMAQDTFNGKSAAQIIWQAAQDYRINPQVLIVLLEKEQGLISDTWPNHIQYRSATGYGCPDTASCDAKYYGLENQIRRAAELFREVLDNVWTNYPVGDNYILYNPDRSCGGSWVNIKNRATSALYRYTPYQPNQGALNAGWGQAPCGAYGNRNFYNFFTNWFGSTRATFIDFDAPRYMQVKNATWRYNTRYNQRQGDIIPAGSQAFFVDKIYTNGQWYARTEYAKSINEPYGLPVNDIEEVPNTPITERWISIPSNTSKVDPIRRETHDTISGSSATQISDSITVEGKLYYRTKWEHSQKRSRYIPASSVKDYQFYNSPETKPMVTRKDTNKINSQDRTIVSALKKDTVLLFNKQLTVDGELYLQTTDDNGTFNSIKASDLTVIGKNTESYFVPLENPRHLQIKNKSKRVSLTTGQPFGDIIEPQVQSLFVDKFFAFGKWYARTKYAHDLGDAYGIPVDDIEDIPIKPLSPIWISIPMDVRKIDPVKDIEFDTIKGMSSTRVVSSIIVGDTLYYRTAWEESINRPLFIPASATQSFRFYDFDKPRLMSTVRNTGRVDTQNKNIVSTIPQNTSLFFNKKLTVDGKLYAQLQSDNGTVYAVPADDLR